MRGRVDDVLVNKGTNGRWRDALTSEEALAWETSALAELGPDCTRWLLTGKMP